MGLGPMEGWGFPSQGGPQQGGVPAQRVREWGLTSWLIWEKDGFWMCRRSVAIRFRAVLSNTTWGGQKRTTNLWRQKEQEFCLRLGSET